MARAIASDPTIAATLLVPLARATASGATLWTFGTPQAFFLPVAGPLALVVAWRARRSAEA